MALSINASNRATSGLLIGLLLVGAAFAVYFIAAQGTSSAAMLVALPIGLAFVAAVFRSPQIAVPVTILYSFIGIGLIRYAGGLQLGLGVDFLLVLTLLALIFNGRASQWRHLRNPLLIPVLIWFLYTVIELFNPRAMSSSAWFYAVRGVSLYMMIAVLVFLMAFNRRKHLDWFLVAWLVISVIGTLWGIRQDVFGPDRWEQAWLDEGNDSTHILWGNLRIFSFYTDAGQYGAAQAHAGVVGFILAAGPYKRRTRILALLVGVLGIYGMMKSGTRGALAVPFMAIPLYLFLSKRFTHAAVGAVVMFFIFAFLKFTYIGQSNYSIQRMRSALNPSEDASFQVRLDNQARLSLYLEDKPLGGGIGSSGYWGQRFTPGTYLAETPPDSWYVRIWMETGVIGLIVHLGCLLFILGYGMYLSWNLRDPVIHNKVVALLCGYAGIMLASYGNQVLGQMPTGIIVYCSWVFIFRARELDIETPEIQDQKRGPGEEEDPEWGRPAKGLAKAPATPLALQAGQDDQDVASLKRSFRNKDWDLPEDNDWRPTWVPPEMELDPDDPTNPELQDQDEWGEGKRFGAKPKGGGPKRRGVSRHVRQDLKAYEPEW